MKRAALASTVFAIAALVAPLVGQAASGQDPALRVRIEFPLTFSGATHECPFGAVDFGISSHGRTGSGRNCLQDIAPAECPHEVEALFCQDVSALMTLHIAGGALEAEVSLFEIWSCGDPACSTFAVDQRWSGRVTGATGALSKLNDASVSGGGTVVLDPATFEFLSIDEELVIGG